MSSGLVANTFEIKSTQLPLVALLLKTPELVHVIEDLQSQFGPHSQSNDFFDNDALVLDFSHLDSASLIQDLPQLLTTLQQCHLKPIAFRNATTELSAKALGCGLIEAPSDMPRGKPVVQKKNANKPVPESVREVVREVIREVPGQATLVIDKPLRSGQKIYARGADLVVLAMVNMGAEVVADGNIHVYAPLRGKAMAGASGNTQARIFSLCLEPELVSIAGVYRTSENPLSKDIQGKPAQVRLSNDGQDKLLFEALNA
ncbi:MAG: septum site-determining protein MinC [Rhodoferax sp.]|nr:septum site-determining protein MinC [Rhodoferax sp.]